MQKVLVRGGIHAHYVASGHLVYVAAATLRAIRFDPARLETHGTTVPVLSRICRKFPIPDRDPKLLAPWARYGTRVSIRYPGMKRLAIGLIAAVTRPRISVLLLLIGSLSGFSLKAYAQAPSAAVNLAAGISQVRAGDFFRALLTLNDVVSQLSNRPEESAMLGRAHAYRALAYVGLDQPERAKAAVTLALKADPNIAVVAGDFTPAVIALFDAARRPATENPEPVGQADEQAGRFRDAFLAYLAAYQALPDPAPAADDRRLRETIIRVVQKLETAPAIPIEAREHATKADELLEAEVILGNTAGASSQTAAAELRQAVRSAPWWPEATFKLASVLQKLQLVDEALLNLNLYRLADPAGYAATVDRANPKNAVNTANAETVSKPIALAVIYVYYPHAARAMGVKPKVLCDGQHVADLENGRFIVLKAPPGFHRIDFRDRNISSSFDGGREYYLRGGIEGYPAHLGLHLTSPDQAAAEMREKHVAPNDPTRTFSTDCKAVSAVPSGSKRF